MTTTIDVRREVTVAGNPERAFDTCEDGSEAWGQVTEWDPPHSFTIAWLISGTWQLETDVDRASRVTATFTAEDDRTRVSVVHKDFWRLGEGGKGMADAVGAADGWGSGLAQFAEFAAG